MKAIINVTKDSIYSHLNGLTFELKDFGHRTCSAIVGETEIFFAHDEVIIVDIQEEYQRAYDRCLTSCEEIFLKLLKYIKINNIIIK